MALDLVEVFRTVDRMDAKGFASYFTGDGTFRFGNAPEAKGQSEITEAVTNFFSSIKALRHSVVDEWMDGPVQIAEVEVTYTRHDDSTVDLTAACVFRTEGDRCFDYRIYMDISPLYASSE